MNTVYVCVVGRFGSDVYGTLLLDSGETLYGHVSSNRDWLKADLVENFGRREELEKRYPDGYEVIVAETEGDVPDEVMQRHAEWWRAKREREEAKT